MTTQQRDGLVLILLAAAGYAFLPILTKNIYNASEFSPTDVAIWRFIFATPILWVVINRSTAPFAQQDHPLPGRTLLLMGIIYSGATLTSFFALERISASMYVVLFYTYPIFVAVLSIFIGKHLSRAGWIALLMTLIGVLFTVPDINALESGDLLGIFVALLNAIIVAVYFVLSNRVLHGHTAVAKGTAYVVTGTLLTLLLFIPFFGLKTPPNIDTWGNLLALAALSTAFPMFAVNSAIQKIGAPRASIISSIQPVVTMLLAFGLLGEIILPLQWVGALLIVASVILLQWRQINKKPAVETRQPVKSTTSR